MSDREQDRSSQEEQGPTDMDDVTSAASESGVAPPMTAVELTVVMATKNRPELAIRMCRSVLRSVAVELEIVIVDDGSSPDAAAMLDGLCESDERVRLERCHESEGPSRARNRGLAAASGKWTSFVDDDDLVGPTYYRTLLDKLESCDAAWGFGAAVSIDDRLQITGSRSANAPAPMLRALLQENIVPASGLAVTAHTSLLRTLGGFDSECVGAEDWDLVIRLARTGEPVMVEEPMLAFRSVSAGSVSADTDRVREAARTLRSKFADEYRRFGVDVDWAALDRYLVMGDLRARRRRSAALRALRSSGRRPRPRAFAKALLIFVSPGLAERQARRRIRTQVPQAMSVFARAWLDEFAAEHAATRTRPSAPA